MRKWEIKLCQKWVSSFHLKTEEIAATRIKFHQHFFHKKEYSTRKICFKLSFPRTKIWNQQGLFQQFIACNNKTITFPFSKHFPKIFKYFALFKYFLPLFCSFSEKITCIPLLSRIGFDQLKILSKRHSYRIQSSLRNLNIISH